MKKKMLRQYLIDNNLAEYKKAKLSGVQSDNKWVVFRETDPSGYYHKDHMISTLDLIVWMFGKNGGDK